MEYKDIETYEKKIARTFFNLAEDIANKELKKLKLENEKLREQLRLHSVSQQRELFNAILDFTEELPMVTEDYSRAELWEKYKALNCG